MTLKYIIEDESHAEWQWEYNSFNEALIELEKRKNIPWNEKPNICPCMSWKTCWRNYQILTFNNSNEIERIPILNISAKWIEWLYKGEKENKNFIQKYILINLILAILFALELNSSSFIVWKVINKFTPCVSDIINTIPCYWIYDIYFMGLLLVLFVVNFIYILYLWLNKKD